MEMFPFYKIRLLTLLLLSMVLATIFASCDKGSMPKNVITQNENYTVDVNKVVEGRWKAEALSATHLVTNYTMPVSDSIPSVIRVRLAINGHDNELRPAQYHYIDLTSDTKETIIKACEPDDKLSTSQKILRPNEIKLSIDLSNIKMDLREKGFFVTHTHDTIYAQDYKGVWITADISPLDIDFSECHLHHELLVDSTLGSNDIHHASLDISKTARPVAHEWKIASPNPAYPVYSSKQKLMDVIHNMSIQKLSEDDNHLQDNFMVSQECYAIALSLAYLEPQKSIETLKSMVKDSIIIDGNGTENYNTLVNKMIWATAAWKVYCVTGDKNWLKYAYNIIVKNLEAIENSGIINQETGLYRATCPYFVSNLNQYYPPWATVADIFETSPLVANIIMEHTYRIVEMMCDEFETEYHNSNAETLKDAINHRLWDEYKGFYSQYIYGGHLNMMSPCSDNLGQALCVLWDIADDDRAERLVNEMHITNYGVPLSYPINNLVKSEFNNAVIPMVQAIWNIAAARNGNIAMLRKGIGAQLRPQALIASCNAACSATDGRIIDSSYARGNAAGNLAIIYNVIAGMNFLPNGIEFLPKVPICFSENKTITSFKYRNAVFDITIKGTGDELSSISLDGNNLADNFINADISGRHKIVITMNNNYTGSGKITLDNEAYYMPETPLWQWDGFYGTTYNYNANNGYKILINNVPSYSMRDSVLGTRDTVSYRSFSLMAVNKYGNSYISKPHFITTSAKCYDFAKYNPQYTSDTTLPSFYGHKPIAIVDDGTWVSIPVSTDEAGDYIIDVLYSNGNSFATMQAPCNMLEVSANGHKQGIIATPQLGIEQWLRTAYSSSLNVKLLKGENTIQMRMHQPAPPHTSPTRILLSHMRIIKRKNSQ